ncbi:hypothetical protein E2F48_01950 [Arthrobacter crusticola]|uniref:Uncharacterized protein n=1 Tax=Arthrobacter crusticola TaxID=2547960 RepID=A0A4R5U2K8_9MICC|nr:hypothetical protein [Arthrobacter crusticola]TDK27901.1 hypothetical protein E2F48_01950 [Arthrobacter crusticola]
MGEPRTDQQTQELRELSTQLARLVIDRAAPDELLTFDEVAEEYYEDPQTTLMLNKKDEAVGFGLELALLTPFALAMAEFVVDLIGDLLRDVAKDVASPAISGALKRMLRVGTDQASPPDGVELTKEQRAQIFAAAREQATRLGLDEDKAVLLGSAIIGVLGK